MSIFTDTDIDTDTKKFMDYTKLSSVTYFNKGAYGIGYKVKINDLSRSNYNVLSLHNTETTIKCGQLFVKLSPIYDGEDDDDNDAMDDLIKNSLRMNVTPSRDFLNEIRIQTEIYKKSNSNLEAICPPIVYSNVVNNTGEKSRAQNVLSVLIKQMPDDVHKTFLEGMKILYEGNRELQLGIIVMSFAENYDTLANVMDNTHNLAQQIMYKYLAIYELLRLYDLGYMHGDYHTKNILINTNYKYSNEPDIYTGRCLIIDYGMGFKNNYVNTSSSDSVSQKLHNIAQEKQPDTEQNAYTWNGYKWLLDFLNSESDIDSGIGTLKESIDSFQQQMIGKINEKYPDLMNRIRTINDTIYRGSVLRGGRAIADKQYDLKELNLKEPNLKGPNLKGPNLKGDNTVKLHLKVNHKPLSNEEFIQIFNPQDMNMTEIVNKYENTLQEGIAILNNGKKLGGKKRNKTYKGGNLEEEEIYVNDAITHGLIDQLERVLNQYPKLANKDLLKYAEQKADLDNKNEIIEIIKDKMSPTGGYKRKTRKFKKSKKNQRKITKKRKTKKVRKTKRVKKTKKVRKPKKK
jgi:tRNA A-37 threonylcarbamoyl transferase component Bud32